MSDSQVVTPPSNETGDNTACASPTLLLIEVSVLTTTTHAERTALRTPSAHLCKMDKIGHSNRNQKAASLWADVSPDVFGQILSNLNVSCKLRCEAVCVSWRKALRDCPAPGLCGPILELADSPTTRKNCNLPYSMLMSEEHLILPAANLSDSEQLKVCGRWLQQRAIGFLTVRFGSESCRGIQLDAPGNVECSVCCCKCLMEQVNSHM